MKKLTTRHSLSTAGACLLLSAAPALAQVRSLEEIQFPELPGFEVPTPEVVTLDNGLTIFLLEDHELPLIDVNVLVRAGSLTEPADKAGLGDIVGEVLRTGGTEAMSGDDIDDFLESRAASVETGMSDDFATASMSCLSEDFDEVLPILAAILRTPRFAEDKIELAKVQANTGIARRNDNVGGIVGREFQRLVYGLESPLSRLQEYASIAAIGRDDLVAFHRRHYHPNSTLIGVVGDFDSAAMRGKLASAFGDWTRGPQVATESVPFRKDQRGGVYFIEKADVTQANIRLGHLGIQVSDPDFFAVQVLNEVFGGGFSSRLFSNVRTKKGLAYAVFGTVGSDLARPGVTQLGISTKSETMGAAVDALREEVQGMLDNPPTGDELARAKESILNSFVFNYASRRQVLNRQLIYHLFGLPADFLETYRARIEQVTAEEVAAAARNHLHPEEMTLLVVGKAADFDRPMSSFGEVEVLDITIPPPPVEEVEVERSEASAEAGRAVLARVAATLGGPRAGSSRAVRTTGKLVLSMGGQSMSLGRTELLEFPNRIRQSVLSPMGEQVVVIADGRGSMSMGPQSRPLPADKVEEELRDLGRDLRVLVRYADDPALQVFAAGEEAVDGVSAQVIAVSYRGADCRLWVAADGTVLRQTYQGTHPMTQAPGQFDVRFADYREIEGAQVPHQQTVAVDGQGVAEIIVESFELDPEIPPESFEVAAGE